MVLVEERRDYYYVERRTLSECGYINNHLYTFLP